MPCVLRVSAMQTPFKVINFYCPDSSDGVRLRGFSDFHLGNVFCSEKELRKNVDEIASEKNSYVILVGDMLELATKNSVSDIWSQHTTPWQQIELAAKILQPIKDRILCATDGNHEQRAYRYDGLLPMRSILTTMGFTPPEVDAKHAQGAGVVFIKIDAKCGPGSHYTATFSLFFRHGHGGGATMGAKANRLYKMKEVVIADLYMMAHDHVEMLFGSQTYIATPGMKDAVHVMRHGHINTGSFLGYGGYAVDYGFPPCPNGTPHIDLYAWRDKHGIHKSMSGTMLF